MNFTQIKFDGNNLTGIATSSNNVPIDPVSIGTFTSQSEILTRNVSTSVDGFEKYNFTETTNIIDAQSFSR